MLMMIRRFDRNNTLTTAYVNIEDIEYVDPVGFGESFQINVPYPSYRLRTRSGLTMIVPGYASQFWGLVEKATKRQKRNRLWRRIRIWVRQWTSPIPYK